MPDAIVAVIGAGRMGAVHARNVLRRSDVSLGAIFVRSSSAALMQELKDVPFLDVRQLREWCSGFTKEGGKRLLGVIVASGSAAHPEHVRTLISLGVPVLCEKPLALEPDLVQSLCAEAVSQRVPLVCGYQRRFDDSFRSVSGHIKAGAIGKPHILRLTSRDHPAPPVEVLTGSQLGSFFQDFATHDVDVAKWMVASYIGDGGGGGMNGAAAAEVVSVAAFASSHLVEYGDGGQDDTAVLVLKFASGAIAVIDNSRRTTYGYDIRVEILGGDGLVDLSNPVSSVTLSNAKGQRHTPVLPYSFPERFAQAYETLLDHWIGLARASQALSPADDSALFGAVPASANYDAASITLRAQAFWDAEGRSSCIPALGDTAASEVLALRVNRIVPQDKLIRTTDIAHPIGVALFGCGRMGRTRAAALTELGETGHHRVQLRIALDVDAAFGEQFARDYAATGVRFMTAAAADAAGAAGNHPVWNDPNIQAVFITTTSASHRELILAACKHGKHVFVEKPLALSAHDTAVCVDAARENGVVLYCGFQRRHDPNFVALRSAIADRANDKVELLRVSSRDGAGHSTGTYLTSSGGFFYDSLIHDFDIARWFASSEGILPTAVYCVGHAHMPELAAVGDIDAVAVVLYFANGVIVSIDNHRRATYGYDQRVEVHTAVGQFAAGNTDATTVTHWDQDGLHAAKTMEGMQRYATAYEKEVDHFLSVIRGVAEPHVFPDDCLFGAYIADAAQQSLRTGKVVRIADIIAQSEN